MLWRENLVMYDRQTDSWWSQADGKAIRGAKRGTQLVQLPSDLMRFDEWRALHPGTTVLSTGERPGPDRYRTYHDGRAIGVTGRTRSAGALDAKARVLGFRLGDRAFAVSMETLVTPRVVQADAGGRPVVVVLGPDRQTARVFLAREHRFAVGTPSSPRLIMQDASTLTFWDAFAGTAVTGALAGSQLEPVPAHLSFWFSWHSFFPDATIIGGRAR